MDLNFLLCEILLFLVFKSKNLKVDKYFYFFIVFNYFYMCLGSCVKLKSSDIYDNYKVEIDDIILWGFWFWKVDFFKFIFIVKDKNFYGELVILIN